jgi:ATP-dependent protease HslVU (ClpYQ) peptidase subunit
LTTIAIKDGVVASDSQVTGNFKFKCNNKIRRVKSGPYKGYVFCASGRFDLLDRAMAQVESGEFSPLCAGDDEDGGAYVLVGPRRVYCLEADKMIPFQVSRMFATGSGQQFAMAAMLAGKSAADAVRIAAKLDPFTSGPVRTLAV